MCTYVINQIVVVYKKDIKRYDIIELLKSLFTESQ